MLIGTISELTSNTAKRQAKKSDGHGRPVHPRVVDGWSAAFTPLGGAKRSQREPFRAVRGAEVEAE
jgi:hypothetical protein